MAAFNFPASPSNGDTYTLNSVTYQWDGTKWVRYSAAVGSQGSTGSTGAQGAQGAQGHQGLQGAQAHIGTSAPSSGVNNGDLWWDSDGGDLSIYYNDGNSSQWVDINTGPRGAQGGTGPTGAQGATGATGAQGATGPTGPTGSQGATGSTGAQGAANATTINSNTNNYLITGTGTANTLQGESGLTYDGTTFKVGPGGVPGTGGALAVRGSANSTQASFSDNTSGTLRIATASGALNLLLVESGQAIVFGIGDNSGLSTEHLRITSDGRIGMHDSTPNDYELDIQKRASATDANLRLYNNATGSSNDTILRLQIAGTSASNYIYFGDGDDTNAGQIRYSHNNNSMRFTINAGEKLVIDSNGDLNLGLSGSPVSSSSEQGVFLAGANSTQSAISSDVTPFVVNRVGTGGNDRNCIEFRNNGTLRGTIGAIGGSNGIFFQSATTEAVRITSDGQLLVGTTSSSYHFTVDDDNLGAEIRIDNDASNYKVALNTTNSVNADFNIQHKANLTSIGTGVNVPLTFHINGSTNANNAAKMQLDTSGVLKVTGGSTFGSTINNNRTLLADSAGNPIASGTPWFTTATYSYGGSYSGMGYHWIKIVESQGTSSLGYIEYMAIGDSNYPRYVRGTIMIASYGGSTRNLCHDQQTQEAGLVYVRLASDGTVWMRLYGYDWNSDFRFRLVYGESINLNTDFTLGTTSSNSHGRIDVRSGAGPVGTSNDVLPGANVRYNISAGTFSPSGSNGSYGGDTHRFFKIDVANQLIKGSGSFRIDHPLAGMSTSHYLQHSFVEGPQADNIYRGKTTLVAGISTVNIDTASNMTDGTFVELNTDIQCFTTNETGWTPIKGSVSGNKLTIIAQDNSCTDTVSWMVVGERQDDMIKNKADWTDSDGKVIVELPKSTVGFAGTESPYDEFK